jgi:hypothetical protein
MDVPTREVFFERPAGSPRLTSSEAGSGIAEVGGP